MVKAGKTAGSSGLGLVDESSAGAGFDNESGSNNRYGVSNNNSSNGRQQQQRQASESKEDLQTMERNSKEARARQFAKQQQLEREQEEQREKDRNERILKRHLFGVPPPTDPVSQRRRCCNVNSSYLIVLYYTHY